MKKYLAALFVTLALLLIIPAVAADKPAQRPMLRHVVAFKFKEGASAEKITEVVNAFRALKQKISVVKNLEWGTNISPEKHDKGFTHVFTLSFESEKDRDIYAVHADHKAFGAVLGPIMADVFVLDYWSKD